MMKEFPKGSEWRKWDLHVHTPESVLNNQFGTDWDNYVKQLFKTAISKNIKAISITDYFTIEGYKKLKLDYLENEEKLNELFGDIEIKNIKEILIFPNIEFRLPQMINKKKVNFHVIFSDKVSISDIENHFLHNLNFVYSGEPQNTNYSERLKVETLRELGARLRAEHKPFEGAGTDLYIGMMNASISDTDISNELNKTNRFFQKYLIGIPCDEDLSKINWNGQGHQFRKVLIQKADFLMSSNENTRKWSLGKFEDVATQIKEFKSLKPCLWGSDAHGFDNLFEPDKARYTWIKADLTFDGLRQTLFEPESRVFIGVVPQIIERIKDNSTKYISSLTINKNDSFDETWFDGVEVNFNPELVAIIGNKGNGKSAITDILGILSDSQNHEHFSFLSDDKFKNKRDKKAAHFTAKLKWVSEEEKEETLNYIPNNTSCERIKYIPQDFLEVLCNDDNDELSLEIKKVIYSHVPEEDRFDKANLDELIVVKAESINSSISKLIFRIKEMNLEIIDLETKNKDSFLKSLWSKLKIKKDEIDEHVKNKPVEIKKPAESETPLQVIKEITALKVEFDNKIDLLKKEKKKENIYLTKLNNAKGEIDNFDKDFKIIITKLEANLKDTNIEIKEVIKLDVDVTKIDSTIVEKNNLIKEINGKIDKKLPLSLVSFSNSIQLEIKKISEKLDKNNKEYQTYIKSLDEWNERLLSLNGEGKYSERKDSLLFYKEEIKYISNTLSQNLSSKYNERLELVKLVFTEKNKLINIYDELYIPIDDFVKENNLENSDYKIQFFTSLEASNFIKTFLSFIDKGKKGSFCGSVDGSKQISAIYDEIDFNDEAQTLSFLEKVVHALNYDLRDDSNNNKRDPHFQIKKDKVEKFYEFLFSLEFVKPKYDLKLGNTILSKLSPGEKGALLLIFYLLIDKDDIPLILDQPEENLDNQTVFEIVVRFIKQAKRRRQIIIITHNPNLAVVCDAEQIIYSNINKKDNCKVTYESGSIENSLMNKHIVRVLEGTLPAFNTRNLKYSITKRLHLDNNTK